MADLEPNELSVAQETEVREYLSARLDPQLGRAEASFRQFLAHDRRAAAAEPNRSPFWLSNRFSGWSLGLVGAALAASLAVLWIGPSLAPVGPTAQPLTPRVMTPVNSQRWIQQDVQSQTYDDGTYMTDDNTPMRVLHRRDLQRMRVFDANQNLQNEQIVPQDHVIYVPVKTY